MRYKKEIMRTSELEAMGFPKEFLMRAYKTHKGIAWKLDPKKKNSPLLFDTQELEAFRLEEIEKEKRICAHKDALI